MSRTTSELSLNKACEYLREHDRFLILTHAQPDGDTIGSGYALALALKALHKQVAVRCADPIPYKFTFISLSLEPEDFEPQTIVSVDVADCKLLGALCDEYKDKVDLCIDHHISNVRYAKRLLLDAEASATCEIIYEMLKVLGTVPDRHILSALYTGIVTDTGCFKYSNATAKTHRIAAELIEAGVDYAEINRIMFDTKSRARVKIEGAVMDNMDFYFGGRVAVIAITRRLLIQTGANDSDLDGINALSRTIEGVMVGVTLREKEDGRIKISLRTNAPIDATVICGRFGGGGHPRAAGCEFSCPIEEVTEQLLPVIRESLEENGCLI